MKRCRQGAQSLLDSLAQFESGDLFNVDSLLSSLSLPEGSGRGS